ncbi:hypothetical protein GCM10023144_17840 [Pigmentiphaga soli]|uniref:HTH gntR-type domain-containing protein n=1 Tax=Pigmentiphaga soli TaxID=1007095 RepID=A0ABP8GUZ2_9BURK
MRRSQLPAGEVSPETEGDIPSLSQFIYEKLHTAITEGALKPGQLLRQEELASRFNTSRVPLREALQHLQATGLVSLRPRRGYAVTSLDEHELIGLLQMRMLVEGYAGYVATLNRTEEDVKELESCLRALERFPSKNMNDAQRAKWTTLNRRFHNALFAASGDEQLKLLTSNLSAKVQPYILLELSSTQDLVDGPTYHREIYEAFKKGDAATVAILSRMHCEMTAIRFLEVLQTRGMAIDVTPEQLIELGPAASIDRRGHGGAKPAAARRKPALETVPSAPRKSKPEPKPARTTDAGERVASRGRTLHTPR